MKSAQANFVRVAVDRGDVGYAQKKVKGTFSLLHQLLKLVLHFGLPLCSALLVGHPVFMSPPCSISQECCWWVEQHGSSFVRARTYAFTCPLLERWNADCQSRNAGYVGRGQPSVEITMARDLHVLQPAVTPRAPPHVIMPCCLQLIMDAVRHSR